MPDIQGSFSVVTLRCIERQDFELLVEWINMPHVERWWDGRVDMESVVSKYEPRLQQDSATRVYVIQLNEVPIGMIQCYRHRDYPDWEHAIAIERAAGIDYLIGESGCTGKGIGPAAICAMKTIVFDIYPDIEMIVSAPQKDNLASWRALEKAGFERVAERQLESDSPSNSGITYLYACPRPILDPKIRPVIFGKSLVGDSDNKKVLLPY